MGLFILFSVNTHGKAWVYGFGESIIKEATMQFESFAFFTHSVIKCLTVRCHDVGCSIVAINLRGAFFYRDEVADDLEEYKQNYTDILIKFKDYKKFERAMVRAARGNYRRKMEIYLSIIDECRSNNYISFEIPYSILKTAVLFSQHGEL